MTQPTTQTEAEAEQWAAFSAQVQQPQPVAFAPGVIPTKQALAELIRTDGQALLDAVIAEPPDRAQIMTLLVRIARRCWELWRNM